MIQQNLIVAPCSIPAWQIYKTLSGKMEQSCRVLRLQNHFQRAKTDLEYYDPLNSSFYQHSRSRIVLNSNILMFNLTL